MTPDEFPSILPAQILARYRVVSHDSENDSLLTYLGETSRGTPVWVNRAYAESDFKIVVGNVEPHQFAGFSGGVKTAAIGLSCMKTIAPNHAMMSLPEAQLGAYETNPVRQDIEEMGAKIGVHLALNAILNHQRQIVTALAGDPRLVVQTGLEHSRRACQVAVPQKYGLILTSPGGHPKDINVYQSQKALGHAILIARPGGRSSSPPPAPKEAAASITRPGRWARPRWPKCARSSRPKGSALARTRPISSPAMAPLPIITSIPT